MSYPEYQELEEPLLCYIYLNGGDTYQVESNKTYKPLAEYFSLSAIEQTQTRDDIHQDGRDEPVWNNMVQWARRKLKSNGYLDNNSGRGKWKLSDFGVKKAEGIYARFVKLDKTIAPKETEQAFDINPPDRAETTTYRILRDTALARKIKEIHNHKCQLCGNTIKISETKNYSEAHHIKPLGGSHRGLDIQENIIVLCPDHHVQCDYGAIELSLDIIRTDPQHKISQENINYHNQLIFNNGEF